jgi:hypothetical protein
VCTGIQVSGAYKRLAKDPKATLAQIYRLADEGKLEDEAVRLVGDDDDQSDDVDDDGVMGPLLRPLRPPASSRCCRLLTGGGPST